MAHTFLFFDFGIEDPWSNNKKLKQELLKTEGNDDLYAFESVPILLKVRLSGMESAHHQVILLWNLKTAYLILSE